VDPFKRVLNIPLRITLMNRNAAIKLLQSENTQKKDEAFGAMDQETFHAQYSLAEVS
jgi:hypothetical protein